MTTINWLKQAIETAQQPTITLLIGAPGSGKSTWIRENAIGLTVISSDDIIEAWASEKGLTYSDCWAADIGAAEKVMKQNLSAALVNGENIIVDRTNMSKKVRRKMLGNVPKTYLKFAGVFMPGRDELLRRLAVRNATGKVISEEILDMLLNIYEEPTKEEFDAIFV